MSAGRSSQLVACFSVERAKYLMLSKSIPSSSAPQVGIGLRPKSLWPFIRRSSIHCGSLFSAEMLATTSGVKPRCAVSPATSESDQPHWYRPRASRCWSCVSPVPTKPVADVGASWVWMGSMIWVISGPFAGLLGAGGLGVGPALCVRADVRDVGRADTVAVRDDGEPLDGSADQACERLGLGLAQLREPL